MSSPDYPELSRTLWLSDPLLAFELGVQLAVERWSVLDICLLQSSSSGESDREQFIDCLIEWFESNNGELDIDEVADYLYETVKESWSTELEDESDYQLARLVGQLWKDCVKLKQFDGVLKMCSEQEKYIQTAEIIRKKQEEIEKKMNENQETEEEQEEEQEEKSQEESESVVVDASVADLKLSADEDGWTTVNAKGKGKKK